ncbi:MAG: LTA synthase family protein [Defluviitaleaceae bacterium]|nr:LTA synthase family protein [Defluviitaleaceae bacterium]
MLGYWHNRYMASILRGDGNQDVRRPLLNLPVAFLLLFLGSLCLTAFVLVVIQPNSLTNTAIVALILESNGLIFLYNWLPVVLVLFALFFLTARLSLSCGLAGLIFILPAVVNRFMIEMRHAPLRPLDLLLGMEFMGIARSINIIIYVAVALALLLYVTLLVLAVKFITNGKPRVHTRITGFFTTIIAAFVLFVFVYGDTARYEALPMSGSPFNAVHQYQSKGFIYSFVHALHHSSIEQPPYFDQFITQIQAQDSLPTTIENSANTPHIVMILSEAFSDMPLSPVINFDGFPHPMQNFLEIQQETATITGSIIVPNIGGGTADTEFDILTGINSRRFRGVPYAFTMVTRPFAGFTATLNYLGYRAVAMHPGAAWFYNRQNVYLYLGFEQFLAESAFDGANNMRGGYISEEHTIDRFLEEIRFHIDTFPTTPLFFKGITIQNHGPYDNKYGDIPLNFNLNPDFHETTNLSANDQSLLAQYFHGMLDVDAGLRRLVDYFSAEQQPIILVYYGDHLPSFPLAIYESLILPDAASEGDELIRHNRTPFLIWANAAAQPMLNDIYLDNVQNISAFYLGAILLEMLGISEPFADFANTLKLDYPVILERAFLDNNANVQVFNPAYNPQIGLFNSWGYFRISGR